MRAANQLFLERRRRRAVASQHHEGLGAPRAPVMDGAGHGLGVEPRLGCDEHTTVVACGARKLGDRVGHGRRPSQKVVRTGGVASTVDTIHSLLLEDFYSGDFQE